MKNWAKLLFLLGLAGGLIAATVDVEVRMLTPLRSWKADEGKETRGVVIRPVVVDGRELLPAGSVVRGTVKRAHSVGLGLVRERALVEGAFTTWEKPCGKRGEMKARIASIDNSREDVDQQGRIRGILAANHPMGFARGIWFRPRANLLVRGPAGLTGASGLAWARMSLGPVGAFSIVAARMALTRMPHPEIELPVGTELKLRVESGLPEDGPAVTQAEPGVDRSLEDYLAAAPAHVTKPGGARVADLINLAFVGSREKLDQGFRAAGWVEAETLTKASFKSSYRAFTLREGYATAPVSKLYYLGRLPDLVYQKSLNSMAKRHHVRIWRVTGPRGEDVWLCAATHDVSIAFNQKRLLLTHLIDPELDREREKVLADLAFVGAVVVAGRVNRKVDEDPSRKTDGAIRVAVLQDPVKKEMTAHDFHPRPRKPFPMRFASRIILESRHYLLRDNTYFLAYAWMRRRSPPPVRSGP